MLGISWSNPPVKCHLFPFALFLRSLNIILRSLRFTKLALSISVSQIFFSCFLAHMDASMGITQGCSSYHCRSLVMGFDDGQGLEWPLWERRSH